MGKRFNFYSKILVRMPACGRVVYFRTLALFLQLKDSSSQLISGFRMMVYGRHPELRIIGTEDLMMRNQ